MMRLYHYWRSSSSWRVRIVLHLKNIEFESIPIHLVRNSGEQYAQNYTCINPKNEVPALCIEHNHEPIYITQSVAIIEYLNATVPEPNLIPTNVREQAHMRTMVEIINSGIQPMQNLATLKKITALGGDAQAWAREAIERGLNVLETHAQQWSGHYCIGNQVSLADACLIPQLYSARRFQVNLERYPTLLGIESHCDILPAFQKAHAHAQTDAELTS